MAQYKILSSFYHKAQFLVVGSVHELEDKVVKYLKHAVEKVEPAAVAPVAEKPVEKTADKPAPDADKAK